MQGENDNDYKQFWKKFSEFDKEITDKYCDFYLLSNMILMKFNTDTYLAWSSSPSYFILNNKKYIDNFLRKFPRIWQNFETEDYHKSLKDKILRKKLEYKILNNL